MPVIALEEHYVSRAMVPHIVSQAREGNNKAFLSPDLRQKLADFSTVRLQQMDAAGIDVQVISHTPLPTPKPVPASACTAANEGLKESLQSHPGRFAGFACLSMAEPQAAAEEIENHLPDGSFYDSPQFDPVFAAAQDLDVPLYIHPSFPTTKDNEAKYAGNYGRDAQLFLATAVWGWHADVGLHGLRLFAGGVFDRFPRLRLIPGHMGEMLPYMLDRILAMESGW